MISCRHIVGQTALSALRYNVFASGVPPTIAKRRGAERLQQVNQPAISAKLTTKILKGRDSLAQLELGDLIITLPKKAFS